MRAIVYLPAALLLLAGCATAPIENRVETRVAPVELVHSETTHTAKIVNPFYATDDIVVVDYDVLAEYGADNTGSVTATAAIQKALNDCYIDGGGTVWMPAGTYRVDATIDIPAFCTLRGDWQDPDEGTRYGTIVQAEIAPGSDPLFLVGGSAGAMGMTIYFPQQDALNPVPYGWTFEVRGNAGTRGVFDFHAASVKNVTLLNAYRGIGLNVPPFERSNHELSRVENVKGTALYRGLEARNSSDVGNWRNIHFSNRYWADAPTAYNPPPRATLDSWTRANGTAFTFADVEWDNFYRLSAEDYHVGIHFVDG
ncbi:MAG: glycosyl hydrolase family 28-related protein, partial [Halioglobus sp.]|nr:glycosyl hydrolase family 28-related protein [Halioglobus sp.]